MPVDGVNFLASLSICIASSREGARMRISGEYAPGPAACFCICTGRSPPLSTFVRSPSCRMRAKHGRRKARVFPDPVFATPMRSRPAARIGHVCAWMGIGPRNPCPFMQSMRLGWKKAPASSKVGHGGGAWAPLSSNTSTLSGGSSQPNSGSSLRGASDGAAGSGGGRAGWLDCAACCRAANEQSSDALAACRSDSSEAPPLE
mmetsp:Transcript_26047/g.73602  ORF Transcript_26047/g.73602 Transcript_26047/m.73602 type:complete len:203 (-) Transcript_26047:116-724(-)